MYDLAIYTIICVGIMFICNDELLQRPNISDKARWYLLHFFTNIIITLWTAPYVYIMLTEATPEFTSVSVSVGPSIIVLSLHLFHSIAYTLNYEDVIHHSVMLTLLCIPLYNYKNPEFMGLTNYCIFFLCGLPGGIDYYLMYLVETKSMMQLTEKNINKHLNSWIRSIGILYGAFICYQKWLMNNMRLLYMIPIVIVLIWNAQYYNSLVSVGYGRHIALSSDLQTSHKSTSAASMRRKIINDT